ncbi:MAG: hypothetical protein IPP91_00325 [Betaproteobacteria bacterium]|nr:hypothetical protein [Betaproteobacteria bacterium]
MFDLKVGQELEVQLPLGFEGKVIPEGARVRVGVIITEFFEPNVTLVTLNGKPPETLTLPKHTVMLNCRPAP